MQRLATGKVFINGSKARLFRNTVQRLGHCVSGDGVAPQKAKTQAVKYWPIPKTQTEVRSFLGPVGFYRKFVYEFAAIAGPLHTHKKDKVEWKWTE